MLTLLGKLARAFFEILQTFVLALALFMIVYLFVARPHQVVGQSMYPNFYDGEYLLTDKISYRLHSPKRGDVIVFSAPPLRQEEYIKRIVGLPNETISVTDNKLIINNRIVDENYLPKNFVTQAGLFLKESSAYTLKTDEYFVVGDNRSNSSDSRTWGPIRKSDIVGKTWIIYWPPQKVGLIPSVSYAFE